jgi:hypothetical protein
MNEQEKERGQRIYYIAECLHRDVASLYEKLVDKEYESALEKIKSLIQDLKETAKVIKEDDF